MNMSSVVDRIISGIGSQQAVALLCDTSQQNVSKWKKNQRIPAEYVLRLEDGLLRKGLDISRYEIRPDVYGVPGSEKAA